MNTPQPKRRWLQINLRTLLVFVTLLSVALSWFTWNLRAAKRQRAAFEGIVREFGATYDRPYYSSPTGLAKVFGTVWLRKQLGDDFFDRVVFATALTDAGLEHFADLPRLEKVDLWHYESKVTDDGLKHLAGLSELEELSLRATKITGAGLEHLKGLRRLRTLNLYQTKISDAELKHLAGLSQLESLDLGYVAVTDVGLEHLKSLQQLRTLNLWATQVTDAGLEQLYGLQQLRSISILAPGVTEAGLKKLQQALPNCDVQPLNATTAPVPEQSLEGTKNEAPQN